MRISHNVKLSGGDFMYYRIRDLREDKDLTQEQLAKLLNVSQTTYSRYETGNLDIPSQSLVKLDSNQFLFQQLNTSHSFLYHGIFIYIN